MEGPTFEDIAAAYFVDRCKEIEDRLKKDQEEKENLNDPQTEK